MFFNMASFIQYNLKESSGLEKGGNDLKDLGPR